MGAGYMPFARALARRWRPLGLGLSSPGGAAAAFAPVAPTAVFATSISTSRIDLVWTNNADDATGQRIYRSTDDVMYTEIDDIGADAESYSDTTASANTAYYYKVAPYNSGGETRSSAASAKTPLVHASFASGLDSFDAGTQVAAEGADFATGYLSLPTNTTATRTFTAITSGNVRVDFWFKMTDIETAADTSKNTAIYLLPTAGSIVSGNSVASIFLLRNSADTVEVRCDYRAGASFIVVDFVGRQMWWKFSFVADFDDKTYDLYVNDVLWERGLAFPNSSAADISRLSLFNSASAPVTLFDEIAITPGWTQPDEIELVTDDFTTNAGAIETTTPATDLRSIHSQPWYIPDDQTTYGGFTRDANGLVPDASKECLAMVRCGPEGDVSTTWTTSAAGTIYMGLMTRVWAGLDGDSYLLLRYDASAAAGTKLRLLQGATALQSADPTGVTIGGSESHTLRMVMRGRYLWCYVDDVLQFGGPHEVNSNATGARGMLSEEHVGPYIDTTIGSTDNYCTAFSYTGRLPQSRAVATVGQLTINLAPGSVPELYHAGAGSPTRNIFWSKGFQMGHRSEHDMGNYACPMATLYDATNVKVWRQRGLNISEDNFTGESEAYVTLTRRGVWIADRTLAQTAVGNLSPDHDLRPDVASFTYRVAGNTGAGSAYSDTPYATWTTIISGQALPVALQRLTDFASGDEIRLTGAFLNISNWSNVSVTHKFLGVGDPISLALDSSNPDVAGTDYEMARAYLIELANVLDDTTLTGLRDDLKSLASIATFTKGSLKTDATGDSNTDGFNERYGWYEITCDGAGAASFTMPASVTRYKPQYRLHSWNSGNTQVTIGGVVGTAGTDYVLDDLGNSEALLQILSNFSSDTDVAVDAP